MVSIRQRKDPPPFSFARSCAITILRHWPTPSRSNRRYATAFVVSVARSSCIARTCRWTRPMYRRPLIAVSSTSGRTNARGCGVSEDRERRHGEQSVPPPLRAAALRLLRLPFLPRRRVENSRNPGLRPSLCSFLRCSSSFQIPPCPLRGSAARSRPGRAGPTTSSLPLKGNSVTTLRPLTRAEHNAIRAYAMENGRYWKANLRDDWMNARTTGVMQALRNSHGPSWLVSFSPVREQHSAGPTRAISVTAGSGDIFEATMMGADEPWIITYP